MGVLTARDAAAGTAASQQDRRRIARLFARAAFGATVAEVDGWAARGYAAAVEHLLSFTPAAQRADDAEVVALQRAAQAVDQIGQGIPDITAFQRWWLDRMAGTAYPLEEKLTLYWHGHLTSGIQKIAYIGPLIRQNKLLRDMAAGDFRALCKAITADPAMLLYLDGNQSQANAVNENYGREFLELFTLGRNNGYTQRDVVAAARCFTGYVVDGTTFQSSFSAALHDNGTKTLLGNTGAWGPADVTDIVLDRHPGGHVAARYVATRMASFLDHPLPSTSVVDAMTNAFVQSNYSIRPMVRALLLHPEFVDGTAVGIKSPVELVASTIRALGLGTKRAAADLALSYGTSVSDELAVAATNMGQGLFMPPNVAGWKGGLAWANTATFINRYNFAARAAQLAASNTVAQVIDSAGSTHQNTTQQWMQLLGMLELTPDTQAGIDGYVAAATSAKDAPEEVARGVLTLLIASPDFNLR